MSSVDRSDITNAIWLCGNCHKLVDDDPSKHPAGLLFEWQREHETKIGEAVGKAGLVIRRRYEERHLEEFGRLSYLAERILLEKGDHWEYRLTAEVLRSEMAPILRRWAALKRGLYVHPSIRVPKNETMPWLLDRIAEILKITAACSALMNEEFARAWGEPGLAGDDVEIVSTCRLFAEMCGTALAWEESVRFAAVDDVFSEVRDLFVGVAGGLIEESAKVPTFLSALLASEQATGEHHLDLVLTVPAGWEDGIAAALERAGQALIAEAEGGHG